MNNALAPTLTGDNPSVVVCRPTPWGWLVAPLYCAAQGSLLREMLHDGVSFREQALLLLVTFLPVGVLAIYLATAQIRVDEDSLQWRTWLGWKRVPWRDVLDYFELSRRDKSGRQTSCGVVTPLGQCNFHYGGTAGWTNGAVLRQVIEERAVKARATRWEMLGTRPNIDWPRTFDEGSFLTSWIAPGVFFALAILSAAVWSWITVKSWRLMIGAEPDSIVTMFVILGVGCLLSGWVLTMAISMMRAHRRCRITVSADGIIYSDPNRQVKAAWNEVLRLKMPLPEAAMRAKTFLLLGEPQTFVETTQGAFSFFWWAIQNHDALNACLQAFVATDVAEQTEASSHVEKRKRSNDGIQAKRLAAHTYRTSAVRTMLFALATLPVAYCIAAAANFSPNFMFRLTVAQGALVVLAALPALIGWLAYFTASICIDDEGITQNTLFVKKRLSWTNVRLIEVGGAEPFRRVRIAGSDTSIGYLGFIADNEQLAAEIEWHMGKNR